MPDERCFKLHRCVNIAINDCYEYDYFAIIRSNSHHNSHEEIVKLQSS